LQGSQNGDNVLWVVDGVPGAPIASMNDIETIVVLKDAVMALVESGAEDLVHPVGTCGTYPWVLGQIPTGRQDQYFQQEPFTSLQR